jgi:hypothetical protein
MVPSFSRVKIWPLKPAVLDNVLSVANFIKQELCNLLQFHGNYPGNNNFILQNDGITMACQ